MSKYNKENIQKTQKKFNKIIKDKIANNEIPDKTKLVSQLTYSLPQSASHRSQGLQKSQDTFLVDKSNITAISSSEDTHKAIFLHELSHAKFDSVAGDNELSLYDIESRAWDEAEKTNEELKSSMPEFSLDDEILQNSRDLALKTYDENEADQIKELSNWSFNLDTEIGIANTMDLENESFLKQKEDMTDIKDQVFGIATNLNSLEKSGKMSKDEVVNYIESNELNEQAYLANMAANSSFSEVKREKGKQEKYEAAFGTKKPTKDQKNEFKEVMFDQVNDILKEEGLVNDLKTSLTNINEDLTKLNTDEDFNKKDLKEHKLNRTYLKTEINLKKERQQAPASLKNNKKIFKEITKDLQEEGVLVESVKIDDKSKKTTKPLPGMSSLYDNKRDEDGKVIRKDGQPIRELGSVELHPTFTIDAEQNKISYLVAVAQAAELKEASSNNDFNPKEYNEAIKEIKQSPKTTDRAIELNEKLNKDRDDWNVENDSVKKTLQILDIQKEGEQTSLDTVKEGALQNAMFKNEESVGIEKYQELYNLQLEAVDLTINASEKNEQALETLVAKDGKTFVDDSIEKYKTYNETFEDQTNNFDKFVDLDKSFELKINQLDNYEIDYNDAASIEQYENLKQQKEILVEQREEVVNQNPDFEAKLDEYKNEQEKEKVEPETTKEESKTFKKKENDYER